MVHARQSRAQDFVPGSGRRVMEVGDDFEDLKWNYIANLPKSSENVDGQARLPCGVSANGRWFEPQMRGAPDIVRLVQTPHGGIPGSKGSMLMQTLWSGVPGRASFKPQQDDFVCDVSSKIGMTPVSRWPSVVVRVYLPPFDKWEKRTGNSFGYRALRAYHQDDDELGPAGQIEGRYHVARHVHLFLPEARFGREGRFRTLHHPCQ